MSFDPPVLINCRDRVTPLRELVGWLERAGHERIVLLDNASTYEPLLEYLNDSPHDVLYLGRNFGKRAPWLSGACEDFCGGWYVYTDPDIVPTEDCPQDAVWKLREVLDRYPDYPKAGLGLYLDDVPADMPSLEWERSLVSPARLLEIETYYDGVLAPDIYDSQIDTTFALYRPGTHFGPDTRWDDKALRLGAPYQARHLSWYATEPGDEDRYYLDHATVGPEGSSWAQWVQR